MAERETKAAASTMKSHRSSKKPHRELERQEVVVGYAGCLMAGSTTTGAHTMKRRSFFIQTTVQLAFVNIALN